MKHEAPGTQQLRHISKIGEGVSTAQRSDSLVQPQLISVSLMKRQMHKTTGDEHEKPANIILQ
jgi:hypothetical protein